MVLFSENRFNLQVGLNKLHEYCNKWGLLVNVDKTKCLVFKKGGKKSILDKWHYNNQEIETVTTFKYLGFVFSSTGTFSKGIDNTILSGQRAFYNLSSNLENFDSMFVNTQLSLFNSLVSPVLSYACEIWGFAEAKKIETLHLRFLKKILRVRKTTPSCIVYKECNVYPLFLTRIFRVISFWLKIIKLEEHEPAKILYEASILINDNIDVENKPLSWALHVRKILYNNGFGYIWENQYAGINDSFLSLFKNRLIDSFWQNNNSEIDSLSKNRLYRHLSTENVTYLYDMQNDFIRTSLTKLRLGSHILMVERGRWSKIVYEKRKCILCDDIEDEYHFVAICIKYHDLRVKYLPKSLYIKPSMQKFLNILNSKDTKALKKLGLFLHFAFKKYTTEEILA